ncbi:MAG: hypothetical protein CMJ18_00620 [Phycisphaeraceae bacterium]|nr:hypothetical protein [Phycisphaeraceae bacterium]
MNAKRWILWFYLVLFDGSLSLLLFATTRSLGESDVPQSIMGAVGGMFALGIGLGSLAAGWTSDRWGRLRVMSVGTALVLLSFVGCAVIGELSLPYYLCYWLAATAAGAVYTPAYAMLSEGVHDSAGSKRVSTPVLFFCLAWNLGLMGGQSTGGLLYLLGPIWPVYAAICGIVLELPLLVQLLFTKPQQIGADEAPVATVKDEQMPRAAAFARIAWLSNLGSAFSMTMVLHLLPRLMAELDIAPDRHGLMMAVTRVLIITVYLVMFFSDHWKMRMRFALASQVIAILGLVMIGMATGPWSLLAGLFCVAQLTGHNYYASLYYSTRGSGDERRGIASGLHEMTLAVGFCMGAFIGGTVGQVISVQAPYFLAATVVFTMFWMQVAVYQSKVRTATFAVRTPAV